MAVRLNKRQADSVRTNIQTSQIINRLTKHIDGEVELKPSQVTAALGLLKKTIPDLAKTEVTGVDDGPLQVAYTVTGLLRGDR